MIYNYNRFVKLNENVQEWNDKLLDYSWNGDLKGVKECLENGADVNYKSYGDSTPLMLSSVRGHLEIVKTLIKNSVDVNCKNIFGDTPLIRASYYGHLEIVKLLIENGADVNCKDKDGWTPLMNSSHMNHLEIVKTLIENGADWNIKNIYNEDFVFYLSKKNKEIIIREYPEEYELYILKKDVEKYNL
jgi:ankyrin repeat protein